MAKQKGIVKLEGTIEDITFYKSRDGFLAKGKSGVPASRIATDPAFQRTRENGAEFGRAGKAGKLVRESVRGLIGIASDRFLTGRLTANMLLVIQKDSRNPRGKRTVMDGDTGQLQGFEFNSNGKLGNTLYAPFSSSIDRPGGVMKTNIPAFVPMNMLAAPVGTTHFKIITAGVEIDFGHEKKLTDVRETAVLPLDGNPTAVIDLANAVTANSTSPLFLLLGVDFYQLVNGQQYPLKNGAFNPLGIVQVNHL